MFQLSTRFSHTLSRKQQIMALALLFVNEGQFNAVKSNAGYSLVTAELVYNNKYNTNVY